MATIACDELCKLNIDSSNVDFVQVTYKSSTEPKTFRKIFPVPHKFMDDSLNVHKLVPKHNKYYIVKWHIVPFKVGKCDDFKEFHKQTVKNQ